MKHVCYAVLTAILPAILCMQPVSAQKVMDPYNTLTPQTMNAAIAQVAIDDAALRNKKTIPPRALKDFAKTYQQINQQKWYPIRDGFSADFVEDNIKYMVYYTTGGRRTGSLKKYHEDKLPFEIRDQVKKLYYDYSIFCVEEVETTVPGSELTYVIHMEDAKGYKIIRVAYNEIDLLQEYGKQ